MQHGGFGSTSDWILSQIFGPGGRSRSAFLRTWTPQGRSESASSSPTAGPGESQRGGAFSNQRTSAAARACGEYIARSAALLKTRGAQMMLPVSSHATGALAVEMCRRCGHPEPLDPDAGHRSARPPMQGEHPAPACDLIQPASPVTPRFEFPSCFPVRDFERVRAARDIASLPVLGTTAGSSLPRADGYMTSSTAKRVAHGTDARMAARVSTSPVGVADASAASALPSAVGSLP